MQEDRIAAEIEPRPGQARAAARALQQLGFRVHQAGTTISVDAPARLWSETFGIAFERRTERAFQGIEGSEVARAHPTSEPEIPPALAGLIAAVTLIPPPEFF